MGKRAHPAEAGTCSRSTSPLDVDRTVEVRSTRGRKPMSVEIVRHSSRIRGIDTLADAMVVFCDIISAPLVTAALAHGARQVRILSDAQAVADYAEEHFRFSTQRVVGGAVSVLGPDATDREPLSDQEFAEVSAAYAEACGQKEAADRDVQRLQRMEKMLQKSFAAPSQSLGRLSNPARSTAELNKQQAAAAASFARACAAVTRLERTVQTRSKPRQLIPADLREEWRTPVATNFHKLVTNRVLLLSDTGGAVGALAPVLAAKRLLMCCFANVDSVRERVLAWWSSVSTIDAHRDPDINTRVILVCGPEPALRVAEERESMPRTIRMKVTVPKGATGGSEMEIVANGGIKHRVLVPDGLSEGEPFDVDILLPDDETSGDNNFVQKRKHEDEGELPAAELLAGVLLFQLMQCADVEISDMSPDGPTRHALRAVLHEANRDAEDAGDGAQQQGWDRLYTSLERQVVNQGLAETEADVAELCVVGQYTTVPLYAQSDGVFREDLLAGTSVGLRFDESVRHKL